MATLTPQYIALLDIKADVRQWQDLGLSEKDALDAITNICWKAEGGGVMDTYQFLVTISTEKKSTPQKLARSIKNAVAVAVEVGGDPLLESITDVVVTPR